MCFNNAKMWQLGWYSDRQFEFSGTSTTVELVGISQYTSAGSGQQIVVRIPGGLASVLSGSDFYIGFNRKTGMNSGTVEGGNQVTIQTKPAGSPTSYVFLVVFFSRFFPLSLVAALPTFYFTYRTGTRCPFLAVP